MEQLAEGLNWDDNRARRQAGNKLGGLPPAFVTVDTLGVGKDVGVEGDLHQESS